MGVSSEQRSPVMRFITAFFQEENIKWMLGAGVCILLGSSLRLVTMHWNECTPVWKYLILLSYTGIVFLLGEFSYHRLVLRKTGTVLMSLTVLLIPLSFLALHWVRPRDSDLPNGLLLNTGLTALLGVNLIWSAFASQRIFRHFLRQTQPTFVFCYLTLCLAGAIVPGLPVAWSPILALALWAVFAAGSIKVNRHVFWLTEEHRLPRIFGFFPILLLGAQFGAVFTLGLAQHLSLAWMGLLCTLVALPILLTADTVARVFEQRTGGLVRPIPWSIIGPLLLGTVLCVSGVVLSLTGWPASSAAVPTAALAALSLAVVGQRTQKSAFVWGMVLCVIVTYQTSPVFFKELLLQVRDQAAAAVRESRLPYAFYGLTYAPLILVFSLLAYLLQRRSRTLFAVPLRQTASALSLILFGASFTHPAAILPVALILCPLSFLQTAIFRQRRMLALASLTFLAVAYGVPAFAERVLDWPISSEMGLLIWTASAGLLFCPGFLVDHWSRRLDDLDQDRVPFVPTICQAFGLAATIVASVVWVGHSGFASTSTSAISAAFVAILLSSHTMRWLKPVLGEWTLAFCTYAAMKLFVVHQGDWLNMISVISFVLLAQWLLSYGLELRPATRLARAFTGPLRRVSSSGLAVLFGLFLLNWIVAHRAESFLPLSTGIFVLVWALDAARRFRSLPLATVSWFAVLVVVTATLSDALGVIAARPWWMAAWTVTGLLLLVGRQLVIKRLQPSPVSLEDSRADGTVAAGNEIADWLSPIAVIIPSLLVMVALGNLLFLDWPRRIAGMLALGGLLTLRRFRLQPNIALLFWPLLNWKLFALFVTASVTSARRVYEISPEEIQTFGLPLAVFAAISVWFFEFKRPREWVRNTEVIMSHQSLLLFTALSLLTGALTSRSSGMWLTADVAWAGLTWICLSGAMLANAVRTQSRDQVWWAEGTMLGGCIYFAFAGVLPLTSPAMAYVILVAGLLFWGIGVALESSERFGVLSLPARQTGYVLPLLVVPVAISRHLNDPAAVWAGFNSLPLLGAAAFYFWRGMERRSVGTTLVSAVILNLASAMLFSELKWTDPQLFLIPIGICVLALTELLNREIPAAYHDRLRLAGSLLILVSPTFQIVNGSWLHILTLLIASLAIALVAIGCRVRIPLYTSTAFLMADLVALVARGSVDQPNLLWIVGVAVGASVIGLGAVCENHRETVLSRLRGLAAELEMWR